MNALTFDQVKQVRLKAVEYLQSTKCRISRNTSGAISHSNSSESGGTIAGYNLLVNTITDDRTQIIFDASSCSGDSAGAYTIRLRRFTMNDFSMTQVTHWGSAAFEELVDVVKFNLKSVTLQIPLN